MLLGLPFAKKKTDSRLLANTDKKLIFRENLLKKSSNICRVFTVIRHWPVIQLEINSSFSLK